MNPLHAGFAVALDARFITGVANGAALALWSGRAGTTITASASGGAQPTYLAASINGRPAVQFDGTTDFMDLSAGGLSLTNGVGQIFGMAVCVVDNTGLDATQTVLWISSGTLTTAARYSLRAFSSASAQVTGNGRRLDSDSVRTTAGVGTTTAAGIAAVVSDYSANSQIAAWNGVDSAAQTWSSGAGNCDTTNALSARVGALGGTSNRFAGRVGAVLIGVAAISPALRRLMRHNLGLSFGIQTA